MDEFIHEAFFNSIKLAIKEKMTPMDSSVFYSNYMLLYKNEDVTLDLKHSSYKKIGKFF